MPMNRSKQSIRVHEQAKAFSCPDHGDEGKNLWCGQPLNIIDLLRTPPSAGPFVDRVQALGLSAQLEDKVLRVSAALNADSIPEQGLHLTEHDEQELATEVLLLRHRFTTLVFEHRIFRQAALTIIQNIYLFRHRTIFFSSTERSTEEERQAALLLFSGSPQDTTIPLARTFQHLILARVWDRICSKADTTLLQSQSFHELLNVVEGLNTLRNIYMLLTTGLVGKLTRKVSDIYKQSVTTEDARQIGSFGIARAAYRYHPSCGVRFSTYAAKWIMKEIQRQALSGRLIRISSDLVEKVSRAKRSRSQEREDPACQLLAMATAQLAFLPGEQQHNRVASTLTGPAEALEHKELQGILLKAMDKVLSVKSADVIRRRYGLGGYHGREQSAVEVGRAYGVTRGSIHQLEQSAMKKLRKHLASAFA